MTARTDSDAAPATTRRAGAARPLRGARVLSLALNLPGPAALMRLRAMGARCTKLEPPAPAGRASADLMTTYCPTAYATMHDGVAVRALDLKTDAGRLRLERALAASDVLLTSFRPQAMARLGLDWRDLHRRHPLLSLVRIVGYPGERTNEAGHDLTYMAEHGLVHGLQNPPTLLADMAGALMASEAVLQCVVAQQAARLAGRQPRGMCLDVALSDAAAFLALPRHWGMTQGQGFMAGGHAAYRVYACLDGRVTVAALEPHFLRGLVEAAALSPELARDPFQPALHEGLSSYFAARRRRQIETMARRTGLPLHTLPA